MTKKEIEKLIDDTTYIQGGYHDAAVFKRTFECDVDKLEEYLKDK